MDDITIVIVNGNEYYCPSEYVQYIKVVDGYLVNTSNNTITLYGTLRESGVNSSGYPRITLQSFYKGYIQNTYNATSQILTNVNYKVENRQFNESFMISLIGVLCLILIYFKRGG